MTESGYFKADTLIRMGDGGLKSIEKVVPGDMVYSYNRSANSFTQYTVENIVAKPTDVFHRISIQKGTYVNCAPHQKFLCQCGAWFSADQMEWRRVVVMGGDFFEIVVAVNSAPKRMETVYSLVIADNDNFLVTKENIVAHHAAN